MKYEQFLFQNYSLLHSQHPRQRFVEQGGGGGEKGIISANYSSYSLAQNFSEYFHGRKALFFVVWLGLASYSGDWDLPNTNSFLDHVINQNNMIFQAKIRVDPFIHTMVQLNESKNIEEVLKQLPKCHPYSYPLPPATSRTATAASLFQRSQLSCSPSFVIPGFMKAGTTFFYDMIMKHPMLVKAITGVQFKETGCYLDLLMNANALINNNNYKTLLLKKKGKLMNCFPFVEAKDYIYYGDATVYYSSREMIPYYLFEDNPNMKVLFSLRNPIARTLSHHRFTYRFLVSHKVGNINDCLSKVLDDPAQVLMKWRDLAVKILAASNPEERDLLSKQLLVSYFDGLGRRNDTVFSRCGHLILYSLYYMPVYHWYSIFPRDNIRLINIEYLHPKFLSGDEKKSLISSTAVIHAMNWTRLFDYSSVPTTTTTKATSTKTMKARRLSVNNDESSKNTVSVVDVDSDYLKHQLNAIYR